jgi:hypothetical protein
MGRSSRDDVPTGRIRCIDRRDRRSRIQEAHVKTKRAPRLGLGREPLRSLDATELAQVAGGSQLVIPPNPCVVLQLAIPGRVLES